MEATTFPKDTTTEKPPTKEEGAPTAPGSNQFAPPAKRIIAEKDIEFFKKTKAFRDYLQFLFDLQKSVESKAISATPPNPKFAKLAGFLENLDKWIDEIPPLKQPMRFGNKAYKTWHEKLQANIDTILADILPENLRPAIIELRTYVLDSFGSYDRIDYGTGHELAFMVFLYCLRELGLYGKDDYESVVRNVFYRYIQLMRKLQLTYMLEPAGSHGVWGIDDYHFLPFLFGAAELVNHPVITEPNDIHKDKVLQDYSTEFMYLSCIKFIKEVKKGVPFHESSPILNDISATPSWNKVAQGMMKMYQGEVLFKHPVIKHCWFGTIFKYEAV